MYMSEKITYEKNVVIKTLDFDFDFKGNVNGIKVEKTKGDGDVSTTKDRGTWASTNASLRFMLDEKKVRLRLTYKVEELKGDQTSLYFNAEKEYSFADFFEMGKYDRHEGDGRIHKISTPTLEIVGSYGDAFVMTSFVGEQHNYMTPEPWDRAKAKQTLGLPFSMMPDDQLAKAGMGKIVDDRTSIPREWLPLTHLKMKIDDTGNDLTGLGNIAIKGKVQFTLKHTDNIKVITTIEDVAVSDMNPMTHGNEVKVTKFHKVVDSVLCRGYDICGGYADDNSCKDRVLDYKKLNEYNRI